MMHRKAMTQKMRLHEAVATLRHASSAPAHWRAARDCMVSRISSALTFDGPKSWCADSLTGCSRFCLALLSLLRVWLVFLRGKAARCLAACPALLPVPTTWRNVTECWNFPFPILSSSQEHQDTMLAESEWTTFKFCVVTVHATSLGLRASMGLRSIQYSPKHMRTCM